MKTKKLRIAIILPTILSKNGTAKQALELAKAVSAQGNIVQFFTYAYLSSSSFSEFEKFKIHYCINVKKSTLYTFIKNIPILEKIYLHLSLLFVARLRRLITDKSFDVYNPHDWMSLWVVTGLNNSTPIVANINDVPERFTGILNRMKLYRDRRYKNKINSIIVLDNINKKKVVKWLDINPRKVFIIRSGIDSKKYKRFNKQYQLKELLGLKQSDTLLVCANLLAPNRRYEDVITALKKIKDKGNVVHLLILSKLDFSPAYATFLKKLIRQYRLEKQVHFFDKVFTDEERMTYIKNADILIFPNSPQTWGLTAIEAMALGVPVIVSSGSGVSEVLHDGIDAIIYPKGDVVQLILKIESYLKNKSLFARIAKKGQNYVLNNFSWERFGTEIEALIQKSIKL